MRYLRKFEKFVESVELAEPAVKPARPTTKPGTKPRPKTPPTPGPLVNPSPNPKASAEDVVDKFYAELGDSEDKEINVNMSQFYKRHNISK